MLEKVSDFWYDHGSKVVVMAVAILTIIPLITFATLVKLEMAIIGEGSVEYIYVTTIHIDEVDNMGNGIAMGVVTNNLPAGVVFGSITSEPEKHIILFKDEEGKEVTIESTSLHKILKELEIKEGDKVKIDYDINSLNKAVYKKAVLMGN